MVHKWISYTYVIPTLSCKVDIITQSRNHCKENCSKILARRISWLHECWCIIEFIKLVKEKRLHVRLCQFIAFSQHFWLFQKYMSTNDRFCLSYDHYNISKSYFLLEIVYILSNTCILDILLASLHNFTTVKPVLSLHSKIGKTKVVFKKDWCRSKVLRSILLEHSAILLTCIKR